METHSPTDRTTLRSVVWGEGGDMWDGPKDPFSSGSIGSGQNFPFSPASSPAPPEEMCAGSDAADYTRSVGTWETTNRIDSQFRTTAWDREEDPLPFLALSEDQEGGGEGRYLLGAKFFFCTRCPKPLSLSQCCQMVTFGTKLVTFESLW